jgi:hypothetical protein
MSDFKFSVKPIPSPDKTLVIRIPAEIAEAVGFEATPLGESGFQYLGVKCEITSYGSSFKITQETPVVAPPVNATNYYDTDPALAGKAPQDF